jgi:hypothetical protein
VKFTGLGVEKPREAGVGRHLSDRPRRGREALHRRVGVELDLRKDQALEGRVEDVNAEGREAVADFGERPAGQRAEDAPLLLGDVQRCDQRWSAVGIRDLLGDVLDGDDCAVGLLDGSPEAQTGPRDVPVADTGNLDGSRLGHVFRIRGQRVLGRVRDARSNSDFGGGSRRSTWRRVRAPANAASSHPLRRGHRLAVSSAQAHSSGPCFDA